MTAHAPLTTNRAFYLAVQELLKRRQEPERGLEDFLLAVLNAATAFADRPSLSLEELFQIIEAGFSIESEPFDGAWRTQRLPLPGEPIRDYFDWRRSVIRQIVDLREMSENASVENEFRYFGISAPSGRRWYNFDPASFLECATVGSIGGWEPDDESGRRYVSGPVAVMAEDGSIVSVDPASLPNPTVEISELTWQRVEDFFLCGQEYE